MNDEEFLQWFGKVYNNFQANEKNEDYDVNLTQMNKLKELYEFFCEEVDRLDGILDPVIMEAKEWHGGVTAQFVVYDISGDRIQRFCKVISYCSAFGIDATDDGEVCLSCTIPDVFVHK